MGFIHQLWDETLAGPAPDSGLSRLRYNSQSRRLSASHVLQDDAPVSRSITILRSNSDIRHVNLSPDSGSVPSSPITPGSPFSPTTPRGELKKLTRRKSTSEALQRSRPRSPTGYDWIVLSALDR
ncbi:dormancy-associated protein-like [Heracleum sosnowskyi]|uniref:Dormancy-associated protein-like n=1 Tax=Heracleum sosnowskyi TaxID=360622 RepID=A0AAD8H2K5_9APIA|nr:dormancy-associated protein-like [Heracleum sosnowskyi]